MLKLVYKHINCQKNFLFIQCNFIIFLPIFQYPYNMFIPYKVGINIPTFLKKKNRTSGNSVLKDRKIARKRVHIERIIGLAKTYKILVHPMNNMESSLVSQIISVCFWLCNFRNCIVSRAA